MRPQVTVELKNDLAITGKLHSVDQYLNVKLTETKVVNEAKYPHMVSCRDDRQAGGGQRSATGRCQAERRRGGPREESRARPSALLRCS